MAKNIIISFLLLLMLTSCDNVNFTIQQLDRAHSFCDGRGGIKTINAESLPFNNGLAHRFAVTCGNDDWISYDENSI